MRAARAHTLRRAGHARPIGTLYHLLMRYAELREDDDVPARHGAAPVPSLFAFLGARLGLPPIGVPPAPSPPDDIDATMAWDPMQPFPDDA
jgi:hypothetical protein